MYVVRIGCFDSRAAAEAALEQYMPKPPVEDLPAEEPTVEEPTAEEQPVEEPSAEELPSEETPSDRDRDLLPFHIRKQDTHF